MPQLPRREEQRRLAALGIRQQGAEVAAERPHEIDDNNGDEITQPRFIGNYSKGLRHDTVGDPEPVSYGSLLRALESRDPRDFDQILLGPGGSKLTNPQAGLAFDLEGPDAQELAMPAAPAFASDVAAAEMGELYWMAVARDVAFVDYAGNPDIAAAVSSLNTEFPWYGGPAPVTVDNVFRGIFQGEQTGPYVSQFLLKGNSDPRKMPGGGRNATDGYIAYGSRVIDQRQQTVVPGQDYLLDFPWWLDVQNGVDKRGLDVFDFSQRRFIRSLRDGANYVHFDQVIDSYYNAAWILLSEPTGTQQTANAGAIPMRNREFPFDQGNPYSPSGTVSPTQSGFATFGDPHVLEVLSEVIGHALRAVWWQKWFVHRRLRPEEYGGRVDNHLSARRTYTGIGWTALLNSLTAGGLAPYYGQAGERFPYSYLLPQAFPEGAPTHPAYGAGHATVSGACITILKAFFDDTKTIESPVVPSADGLTLLAYGGPGATTMTVGTELNKLSGNISLFRNAAGVHWRSDDTQSRLFGERIGIRLLQELTLTFNEDSAFFELTTLQGQRIRIQNGLVDLV
ncbi:MAG TPA: vanadium-dependent haloperoxidase [Longimicrobium sp.]|jgi:hypothetical protein